MTKPIDRSRLPRISCPHCGAKSVVRDSQEVTRCVRELRIVCTNDDCGFSAVAQLSFIREIRGATSPNPDIRLPAGRWTPAKPANENFPTPANDDRQESAAAIGALIGKLMTT